MKTSIRRQFAVISIGLLVVTLIGSWFINNTFLEKYYEMDKRKTVQTVYERLNKAADDGTLQTEEFRDEINSYASRYNINAVVIDVNSEMVLGASYVGDELKLKLFTYIFRRPGYVDGNCPEPNTVFKSRDMRTQAESIEMYGQLDGSYAFIITTAMESIRESVRLANRFLAYIGICSVVLGSIVMWYLTRRLTKPILELAEISQKMTKLDFEAKYTGKDKNEIALLGQNINQLSAELEKKISELKTANNELKKDIEKKEQIDEMRKEFLSNVSHELKTPIALIQGYAEGLKEGISDDPDSRDFYCEVIMDEADKMNRMVKKLLTLNQLEFGNDVVAMERFDVVGLIHNYLQSADILAQQSGIEVRMEQSEPVYVWADEFKVEEVFMNYFSNAVNHCAGKKVIDVTVENVEHKIRVSVFNTGEPIPESGIDHIWEKFYKVDKARTREYGGSGVGLSIVKAIMESMNQSYGVKNYTNGVRFWFELEPAKE